MSSVTRHPWNVNFQWVDATGPFTYLTPEQVRAFDEDGFYAEAGKTYVIGVDGNGFYVPGRPGGPLVEPPSGEGHVVLRIEPSP